MKTLIFLFVFTVLAIAQDTNTIVQDERSGKPMLIGYSTREAFSDTSFSWWFNSEYENYEIDQEALAPLESISAEVSIIMVIGTWCSDSRRELPRFYKILDHLNFPSENLVQIAVDREKKGQEGEVTDLNIELVPTFIFIEDGEEIGRIIESPKESLEADMVEILAE